MAAPKPRISCFGIAVSTWMASGTGWPAGIQAGAWAFAWRWLPKVLHMRTGLADRDPACDHMLTRPETDNAAAAAVAALRKLRRERLAIEAPYGFHERFAKHHISAEVL